MKSFKFTCFLFVAAFYLTATSAADSRSQENIKRAITNPPGPEIPKTPKAPLAPLPPTPPTSSVNIPSKNGQQNIDIKSTEDTKMDIINHVKKASCDVTIKLQGIVNNESLERTHYKTKVDTTVCVLFETRYGTGYIWALLGVYDSEPSVQSHMFPVDVNQLKDFSSGNIAVTRPLPKDTDDEETETAENSDTKNSGVPPKPTPVGGSGIAISKIKPLKTGTYYIVYAFFRPFSIKESPNTRILILTVE